MRCRGRVDVTRPGDAGGPGGGPARASPRLAALRAALAGGDGAALERFWAEVDAAGTPLIEPGGPGDAAHVRVTFLWRGRAATENALVLGLFGHREPADGRMARLPGTDVWHRTYRLRADVRSEYLSLIHI